MNLEPWPGLPVHVTFNPKICNKRRCSTSGRKGNSAHTRYTVLLRTLCIHCQLKQLLKVDTIAYYSMFFREPSSSTYPMLSFCSSGWAAKAFMPSLPPISSSGPHKMWIVRKKFASPFFFKRLIAYQLFHFCLPGTLETWSVQRFQGRKWRHLWTGFPGHEMRWNSVIFILLSFW